MPRRWKDLAPPEQTAAAYLAMLKPKLKCRWSEQSYVVTIKKPKQNQPRP